MPGELLQGPSTSGYISDFQLFLLTPNSILSASHPNDAHLPILFSGGDLRISPAENWYTTFGFVKNYNV